MVQKSIQKEESTIASGLDSKDLAILRLLQTNARVTVKEIADKVGLSTTPVHERIKRLEEDGVITQYATLVNPHKVKKGLTVICYVSLKQHNKNAGARFIKSILEMARLKYLRHPIYLLQIWHHLRIFLLRFQLMNHILNPIIHVVLHHYRYLLSFL